MVVNNYKNCGAFVLVGIKKWLLITSVATNSTQNRDGRLLDVNFYETDIKTGIHALNQK